VVVCSDSAMLILVEKAFPAPYFVTLKIQGDPEKVPTLYEQNFVFRNYLTVGRRNLTARSTHEYSLFWLVKSGAFFRGHPVL